MYAYGNKQSNPDNYDNNTYIVMLIFEEKKKLLFMPLDLFHLNCILLPIMKINIEFFFYFIRAILEQKVCSDKSLQKVAIHLLGHRRAIARKHWRLLKSKRGVWTALDSRRNQDRLVGGWRVQTKAQSFKHVRKQIVSKQYQ